MRGRPWPQPPNALLRCSSTRSRGEHSRTSLSCSTSKREWFSSLGHFESAAPDRFYVSGFYCFEPDEHGLVKAAFHCEGYQRPLPSPSIPSTYPTFTTQQDGPVDESLVSTRAAPRVPADTPQRLLQELGLVYPELAKLKIDSDRICFYSESEDENWIIDYLPRAKGLIVAGGDSGHAFKVSSEFRCAPSPTPPPPLTTMLFLHHTVPAHPRSACLRPPWSRAGPQLDTAPGPRLLICLPH